MSERMPKPPEVPPPLPDIEQMADWIISHETPSASSDAKLREPESPKSPSAADRPETYFERRHEVKDDLPPTAEPNTKPMTPIAQVLRTRPVPRSQNTSRERNAPAGHLRRKLTKSFGSRYVSAVLLGFGAALILIILVVIFLVIKALR